MQEKLKAACDRTLHWLRRTPAQTFILGPLIVIGFELALHQGRLIFVLWGVAPVQLDRLTLQDGWGRTEIAPYEGVKAFLCFQPMKGDPSGLGEAAELAGLLLKHKIPIAILNACQSGQMGAEESSLAA